MSLRACESVSVLIIAHRLNTVRHADVIYVLQVAEARCWVVGGRGETGINCVFKNRGEVLIVLR